MAIELDPHNAVFYYNRGTAYGMLGNNQQDLLWRHFSFVNCSPATNPLAGSRRRIQFLTDKKSCGRRRFPSPAQGGCYDVALVKGKLQPPCPPRFFGGHLVGTFFI